MLDDLIQPQSELLAEPEVPSRAVIANSKRSGSGCVLWFTEGSVIESEIDSLSDRLDDLGLDDAPEGISIWEGHFAWIPGGYECPQDGYTEPVGAFRPPTDEEWAAIRAGNNPFSQPAHEPAEAF